MTNDRAVEILNAIIFMLKNDDYSDEVEEAIHKAIEALKAQESNQLATDLQPCKQDDLISRSDVIDMLKREEKILYSPAGLKYLVRAIEALPSIQPEKRTEERTETHSCDLISRQAANEQKAEESLLRTDDKSVSKDDVIYRADAIRTAESFYRISEDIRRKMAFELRQLPPAQPEQTDCEYCHEDIDGYVRPIEKNSHAWLVRRGRTMKLRVCFNGGYRECDILFCPMCGRRTDG